ncbi:hypothetical protein BKA62DRAFT_668138 [Auriculariales sp. MPI-PUGE-AT-0066]|nr:hypothetical protein BKA62DRAFT_668138 [Auriculariales sp. MPI-PUGE-AT-0066]
MQISQTSSDSGDVFASDHDMAPSSQIFHLLEAINTRVIELERDAVQLKVMNKAQEQLSVNLSIQIAEERIQRSLLRQECDAVFDLCKQTQREAAVATTHPSLPINRDQLPSVECPSCVDVMYEPKTFIECGHTVCSSCERNSSRLSPAHCPVCLILIQQEPIVVHKLATLLSFITCQVAEANAPSDVETSEDNNSIPDGSQDTDGYSIPDGSQDPNGYSIPDSSQDPDDNSILDGSQDPDV